MECTHFFGNILGKKYELSFWALIYSSAERVPNRATCLENCPSIQTVAGNTWYMEFGILFIITFLPYCGQVMTSLF